MKMIGKIAAVLLYVCILTTIVCGCGVTEGFLSKNTETGKEKDIEKRTVVISMEYASRILGKADKNTEIAIYIDGIEIGKMNCGDVRNFEVALETGKHKIQTRRLFFDKDVYTYHVEPYQEGTISPEAYLGLKYTFHGLASNGELKESEFVSAVDKDYIWVDLEALSIDGEKLDKSKAVNITELARSSENAGQFCEKMKSEYGTEFEMYNNSYISDSIGIQSLFKENGCFCVMLAYAYDPMYVMDGIWCGMEYELAYETLKESCSEEYGKTLDEGYDYFLIHDDLLGIKRSSGRVSVIMYIKDAAYFSAHAEEIELGDLYSSDEESDIPESEDGIEDSFGEEERFEYIFPESSERFLEDWEIEECPADMLRLGRNEIYARHGRRFADEALQEYFDSKSWYEGTVEPEDFNDDALNEYEKSNLEKIAGHE